MENITLKKMVFIKKLKKKKTCVQSLNEKFIVILIIVVLRQFNLPEKVITSEIKYKPPTGFKWILFLINKFFTPSKKKKILKI